MCDHSDVPTPNLAPINQNPDTYINKEMINKEIYDYHNEEEYSDDDDDVVEEI